MIAIPKNRPKISREEAIEICQHFGHDVKDFPLTQIAIRGYYLDSIGAAGKNDRGVYDDAHILIGPNVYRTFNGNADPNSYRKGYGTGNSKGMARLKEGLWKMWKIDLHKGKYEALCQRMGKCTVIRDGIPEYEHTSAWHGINNHKGGISTTASLGCLTVPPAQWDEYILLAKMTMEQAHGSLIEVVDGRERYRDLLIPNILIEENTRRNTN